jgi:hypothetical protein
VIRLWITDLVGNLIKELANNTSQDRLPGIHGTVRTIAAPW